MKLFALILCGPICNQNGQILRAALAQALLQTPAEEPIHVDFAGCTGVTASFLAQAFGTLLDQFTVEEFNRVSTLNLEESAAVLFNLVANHSIQYKENSVYRDICDSVLQLVPPAPEHTPIHTGEPNRIKPGTPSPYVQRPTKAIEIS
jgi:hypothetical protein